MSLDPMRSTAHGFWRYSAEYFHAAEAVRGVKGRELLMPALQLYGQSIELALKAFLLKRGVPLGDVKKLSHKLTEILALARKRRLGTEVKLSQRDIALIQLLGANYAMHRFRYSFGMGQLTLPSLSQVPICTVGGPLSIPESPLEAA